MGAGGEGAGGARSLYYGIDDARCGQPELEHAADAKVCPTCGARLEYALCFYGHLGHYRCPNGHRRPAPTVRAVRVRPDGFAGTDLAIEFPAGEVSVRLPVPGLYNVYNALAAAAAAHALGVAPELIRAGLERFTVAFGRLERVEVDGRSVYLVLAKNPVGMNEALRTLFAAGGSKRLLMALNDLDADGRDVSWIWDADFERVSGHAAALTISGRRAADLAVRLKYAGALAALPGGAGAGGTAAADGGVRIEADLARALDAALAAIPPGEALYAVLTYTAMLELRRVLAARGYLRAYWEDE
jgi:UDP-N-acetylmuramyl tripeptide synthase